ncbi:unnamed protein product [Victoria cruziana]
MERAVVSMEKGANCSGWSYNGQRMASASVDGTVSIYDADDPTSTSSSFTCSYKWKAHKHAIAKVVWVPPEYGDAIVCICVDGTFSVWEETDEGKANLTWKLCKLFESKEIQVLDLNFGNCGKNLMLAAACADGHVRVYELLDPLELKGWQLQAEFQNVSDTVARFVKPSCLSASIAWSPQRAGSQRSMFILGFNSEILQLNSSKVWEFDEAHQRWKHVAELSLPGDQGDPVYAVAWAPNIGRPYEVVAVATCKGIAIWHLGLKPDSDGRISSEKVALLSGHDGEVWQLEWDMSGMTLATAGSDGMVRLWQSNLNGVWHEQATLDSV